MKKCLLPVLACIAFMPPAFAGASSKSEQCKDITETMLEIAVQGAGDEALQKLKSKEVYDKAYSSCMTGTEDEVGELYEKLH